MKKLLGSFLGMVILASAVGYLLGEYGFHPAYAVASGLLLGGAWVWLSSVKYDDWLR